MPMIDMKQKHPREFTGVTAYMHNLYNLETKQYMLHHAAEIIHFDNPVVKQWHEVSKFILPKYTMIDLN